MTINKLDTTGSWAVNGTPIYIPSAGVKVAHTNVAGSGSGRTEDGVMHIDWVRRDVRILMGGIPCYRIRNGLACLWLEPGSAAASKFTPACYASARRLPYYTATLPHVRAYFLWTALAFCMGIW